MTTPDPRLKANGTYVASLDELTPERLTRMGSNEIENLLRRWMDLFGLGDTTNNGIFPAGSIVTDDSTAVYYKNFCTDIGSSIYRDFDLQITDAAGSTPTLKVMPGLAYDIYGRRIFVSGASTYALSNATATDPYGNLKPKSTGNSGIGADGNAYLEPTKYNWVFIKYLSVVGQSSGAEYTSDSNGEYTVNPAETSLASCISYTHWVDGYKIVVVSTDNSTTYPTIPVASGETAEEYIYLGVIYPGTSGLVPSYDTYGAYSRKFLRLPGGLLSGKLTAVDSTTYAEGSLITFLKHIRALGTGGLTGVSATNPHGMALADLTDADAINDELRLYFRKLFSNALIPATYGGTLPLLYTTSSGTLNIANLQEDEYLIINGKRFSYTSSGIIDPASGTTPTISKAGLTLGMTFSSVGYYYVYLKEDSDAVQMYVNNTGFPATDPTIMRIFTVYWDGTALTVTSHKTSAAVDSASIQDAAVTASKLAPAAVTTSAIADANVTAIKLQDSAVTTSKIDTDAVTLDKMADASVGTSQLVDGCVTAAKLSSVVAIPIGATFLWHNITIPEGYVSLLGQAIGPLSATLSSLDYLGIYNHFLGTAYTSTQWTTNIVPTAYLPNMGGIMPIGVGTDSLGNSYAVGATGGVATVTLTANQSGLPSHLHGMGNPYLWDSPAGNAGTSLTLDGTWTQGTATTGGTAALEPHENRPPYHAFYFISKYK